MKIMGKDGLKIKTVVCKEDFFDTISSYHSSVSHAGSQKTFSAMEEEIHGIPRYLVEEYIKLCQPCCLRRSRRKKAGNLQAIVSNEFLERVQIDLVDMQSFEHAEYRYILHVKDHFTKFCWLRSISQKRGDVVAEELRLIFRDFGAPKILQSDNGKEFVNQSIKLLMDKFNVCIVHGRPRRPQVQGLVEQANGTVQDRLSKIMEEKKSRDWPRFLDDVQLSMNTTVHSATKKTPYESVFGIKFQRSRFGVMLGEVDKIMYEENDEDSSGAEENEFEADEGYIENR